MRHSIFPPQHKSSKLPPLFVRAVFHLRTGGDFAFGKFHLQKVAVATRKLPQPETVWTIGHLRKKLMKSNFLWFFVEM
jgi:hypothetical protein